MQDSSRQCLIFQNYSDQVVQLFLKIFLWSKDFENISSFNVLEVKLVA